MVIISAAAEKHGLTEKGTAKRISGVLEKYNLKTNDNNSVSDIVKAMSSDKKRIGSELKLVLISSIGNGFVHPVSNEKIPEFFGV